MWGYYINPYIICPFHVAFTKTDENLWGYHPQGVLLDSSLGRSLDSSLGHFVDNVQEENLR